MAGLLRRIAAAAAFLAAAACQAGPWDSVLSAGPRAGVEAALVSRTATIPASGKLTLGILLQHKGGSHSYWINPGSAGYATSVEWKLPKGASASALAWPAPSSFKVGKNVAWGYSGETLLASQITLPAGTSEAHISAHVAWLACKDQCVPGEKDVEITLKAGAGEPSASAPAFEAAAKKLPQPGRILASYDPASKRLQLQAPGLRAATLAAYSAEPGVFESASVQSVSEGILAVAASRGYKGGAFTAVLVGDGGPAAGGWARQGRVAPQSAPLTAEGASGAARPQATGLSAGLAAALAMAFAGGLILNLMPCVFPVLSLKVLSLVRTSQRDLAVHGLAFAGGVEVTMMALAGTLAALRLAGSQIGWGFQLQSPAVVAVLALLFAAIALNLWGTFEVTAALQGPGRSSGVRESFLTGMLAVFVATPCTAPFMGAALGYAITQPAMQSAAVFASLGAGMAFPWVAITLVPALARLLPRPGAWMNGFRKAMALPMALSALWLVWVFFQQAGGASTAALSGAIACLAAALWLYGRLQWGKASSRALAAAAALACLGLAGFSLAGSQQPDDSASASVREGWSAWSHEAVRSAVSSGQGAFVDFTAAWCLTCQANHQLIFSRSDVREALRSSGLRLLVADWTSRSKAIAAELEKFGRTGIPLYVVYRPDGSTQVLPEIPLPSDVIRAVRR